MAQTTIRRNDPKAVKRYAGDRSLSYDVRSQIQEDEKRKRSKKKRRLDKRN